MNERDLKLYSYLKGKGGGGGESVKSPQVVDYLADETGDPRSSYTSRSFSLEEGDTLVIAFMHRASITMTSEYTLVGSRNYNNAQFVSIYKYVASGSETKTVSVTQSSSVRMSVYIWQMKNVMLSEEPDLNYSGAYGDTTVTIANKYRPTLMILSNIYSGTWGFGSDTKDYMVCHSPSTKFTAWLFNMVICTSSTFSVTSGGDQWFTIGIYLTEE